jgi:hypothetical protein
MSLTVEIFFKTLTQQIDEKLNEILSLVREGEEEREREGKDIKREEREE